MGVNVGEVYMNLGMFFFDEGLHCIYSLCLDILGNTVAIIKAKPASIIMVVIISIVILNANPCGIPECSYVWKMAFSRHA